MDWTGWLLIIGIVAAWAVTQWAFSLRRGAEKRRGQNSQEADGMLDVERGKAQGTFWSSTF